MKKNAKIFSQVTILIFFFFVIRAVICSTNTDTDMGDESNIIVQNDIIKWPPDLGKIKVKIGNVSKKNYYIIFDGSGSMAGSKIIMAKKALKKFISIIPDNANIGLLAFDKAGTSERANLGSSKEKILKSIDNIFASGGTPLGKSMEKAYLQLGIQANKQLGYGEYNLVIITDGIASDESKMIEEVEKILSETPIIIHTIGFQIGEGHSLNQPGRIYYKVANNFEELSKGLEEVLAESENFTVKEY
jgi:Ca-activated chloride channel homolog